MTDTGQWKLAAPLTAFFLAFFAAPLLLLVVVSLQTEKQMTGSLGVAQYVAFFADTLNLSVLGNTLLVGVKATAAVPGVRVIRWPGWRCGCRRGWQSALVFVIVLPIVTSVVVRTFAWIVILGRNVAW